MELTDQQITELQELIAKSRVTPAVATPTTPVIQPPSTAEPQVFRIRLGDQDYEARSQEELQRLVNAYDEQRNQQVDADRIRLEAEAQRRTAAPAAPVAGDQFDKETYAKLFMEDPRRAQQYLIQNDPAQVQFYSGIISELTRLKQENAASQFLMQNSDYVPTQDNFKAIDKIITQYNLPWDINGMNAAFALGKTMGMIETNESESANENDINDVQPQRVAPPRIGRRQSVSSQVSEADEMINNFANLTPDQQKKYLESLAVTR